MTIPEPFAVDATPVCPRHPGVVSYVRCQRCERPTCPSCQVPAPVGIWCVDCVRESAKSARPVRNSLGFVTKRASPVVTYGLIAINALLFVAGLGASSMLTYRLGLWPDVPADIAAYQDIMGADWWRWITSGFVHFGIIHLAINMWMLWRFGSELEVALGAKRFVVLYFLSLLGGSAAVVLLGEWGSVHGGASGAIFGLIAATAVVLRQLNLDWKQLAGFAGLWLAAGFFIEGLSWEGHLGGAVAGAVTMLVMLALTKRGTSS